MKGWFWRGLWFLDEGDEVVGGVWLWGGEVEHGEVFVALAHIK